RTRLSTFPSTGPRRTTHSFPTRRSSDLADTIENARRAAADVTVRYEESEPEIEIERASSPAYTPKPAGPRLPSDSSRGDFDAALDRKSTRLNSSHVSISYAVFCLKK